MMPMIHPHLWLGEMPSVAKSSSSSCYDPDDPAATPSSTSTLPDISAGHFSADGDVDSVDLLEEDQEQLFRTPSFLFGSNSGPSRTNGANVKKADWLSLGLADFID
eukprot:TRINITY_DN13814_c0_g1::TRINITY_DN13814_c0_g1_i1::g.16900::m.16900 TRINITY_DN13814_c0_g1::TRINITY_DN13814_c0_g1_i1::g.16900  ORF type:complete len:106 (-),score=7.37 TRINITY_DN13814_c0_g1_i1:156-473(-)